MRIIILQVLAHLQLFLVPLLVAEHGLSALRSPLVGVMPAWCMVRTAQKTYSQIDSSLQFTEAEPCNKMPHNCIHITKSLVNTIISNASRCRLIFVHCE